MNWEPLPPEVAEWMGIDDAGLPDVTVSVQSDESPVVLTDTASATSRRGVLGFIRRPRRVA